MPEKPSHHAPSPFRCPQCGRPVSADDLYCSHCGVNLGIAAVMAEREVFLPSEIPFEDGLGTDALVPRLGERLVQAGLITPQQLEEALAYQRKRASEGAAVRLGEVLVTLGMIDRNTLDKVIAETIFQLQEALYKANERLQQQVEERTRRLQAALERIAELQQMKNNFVSAVSHELRTPLTHLIGYLDLMAEGTLGSLEAPQQEAVRVMRQATERLHRLIEDLISFSLLARGSVDVMMVAVEVAPIVAEAVKVIASRASAKSLDFRQEVTPGLTIFADGEKIAWVLTHLLDNAVKFTPRGGSVVLKVWPQDEEVFFSVEDNGMGISSEDIERIFEPFVQLEDASARQHGGTGLGLALVREILGAHDAVLQVESEPGQGSRFAFSLPRSWKGSKRTDG